MCVPNLFRLANPAPRASTLIAMSAFDAEVTIRRMRFGSRESGFAVLDADADGERVVLVGPLVHLEERERVRVIGRWVKDSRYGDQVKVSEAVPLPPSDVATLVAYLRRVKHVGPKRAEALVARYGAGMVFTAIDDDPGGAFAAVGLSRAGRGEAAESWSGMRVTRRLHLMLARTGSRTSPSGSRTSTVRARPRSSRHGRTS